MQKLVFQWKKKEKVHFEVGKKASKNPQRTKYYHARSGI